MMNRWMDAHQRAKSSIARFAVNRKLRIRQIGGSLQQTLQGRSK